MSFRAGQARRGLTAGAGRAKVQAKPAAEQGAAKAPTKPSTASETAPDAANAATKQTPASLAAETAKIAEADAAKWGPVWPVVRSWRLVSARLKELWTRYGWLTIITWFGMYNVVLWGIFAARRTGVFKGMESAKVQKWLNDLSLKKRFYGEEPIILSPVAIDFLVAWLLVKTTEPLRAIVIIMLVPVLVRRLPPWLLFRLGAKNIPGRTGGPGM
jgi:uncharacterized membrane protein YeiB